MRAHERKLGLPLLEALVGVRVVVDFLAAPLLPVAAQDDDRAPEREAARNLALERLELVRVDAQRKLAHTLVQAHARSRRRRSRRLRSSTSSVKPTLM